MDSSSTSLSTELADTFCLARPAGGCEAFLAAAAVLLLSEFSKYSVMNFSKAAISSSADWLISAPAAEARLQSLVLLELLDFLLLAVDWLLSVLPMLRLLACLGRVL